MNAALRFASRNFVIHIPSSRMSVLLNATCMPVVRSPAFAPDLLTGPVSWWSKTFPGLPKALAGQAEIF
jgi:hypothetical protein